MSICKVCGAKADSEYCFKHKKRKPLVRAPLKKSPAKRRKRYYGKKAAKRKGGVRRKSVRTLKTRLDRIFSIYIRLRDADKKGTVRCFTSGKPMFWKESQNGHFMSRRHNATRFDERNCHAQSPYSNLYLSGEQYIYGLNLDLKYGEGTAAEISALSKTHFKFTIEWLEERIKHYENEVLRLKTEKDL